MSDNKLAIYDWYNALVEDCQAIITETAFDSRWRLIERYPQLGRRILDEHKNFDRQKIYGQKIVQCVAESIGKSERTIEYAVQFAKKFKKPEDLPDGKNASWSKVCKFVLPNRTEDGGEIECSHEYRRIVMCTKCGKKQEND